MVEPPSVTLFNALLKRETGGDLPDQTTDEDLLAWAEELKRHGPRRRQLVADPLG
jgi:hypothetical protein